MATIVLTKLRKAVKPRKPSKPRITRIKSQEYRPLGAPTEKQRVKTLHPVQPKKDVAQPIQPAKRGMHPVQPKKRILLPIPLVFKRAAKLIKLKSITPSPSIPLTMPKVAIGQLTRNAKDLPQYAPIEKGVYPKKGGYIREKQEKMGGIVSSAVARSIWYFPTQNLMEINYNDGGKYHYFKVPLSMFEMVYNGMSITRTEGHNRYGRWWKGKFPSNGAAIHWRLKQSGIAYRRIS